MPFPKSHPSLERALADRGYLEPTPVQAAVLQPDALSRDLLVSAQTGSGKTVAYGLAFAPTLLGEGERFPPAAGPPARPPGARPARFLADAGRGAGRGRRDARPRLPGGPHLHPRRHPGGAP